MTKSLKVLPNKVFRFIQPTLNRVCGKKFIGGVRSRSSGVGRQESGGEVRITE
ncbi:unknown protein [Microcystis aeruginosa NIES-843]|uniref:Uncharacterized protein n=1 Tax=Microcystis aeruginosa (strain NIES-843 / IAM M-2473) TaxID=449447 RepID=B0JYE0_MICAN|nr:unknown protein [Microcystis aeruginosa NIES-843]